MSKFINGGIRPKNARENYVEQLSHGRGLTAAMNKKRETFTSINPSNDTDLAYRSTSNYLREMAEQGTISPTEMIIAQNVPRTKSASELTPRTNLSRSISGNPKYKAQEDYYDEIQALKKDMKTTKEENSNLRAKIRRLEEDNTRKRKEIDVLYDSNKDGDLRRTLTGSTTDRNDYSANTANVVMSLKQRMFKLESELKKKEAAMDELKSDPRWTKSAELELQNRALFGEVERQKVERLNYIQKNDYVASVDEEKKNAVRKMTRERDELKEENQSLKKKVQELQRPDHAKQLSPRSSDKHNDEESLRKTGDIQHLEKELAQVQKDLKRTQRELEQVQEKFEEANGNLTRMKREKSKQNDDGLEEIKRDRDEFREKSNRANKELNEIKRERDQYKSQLDRANEQLEEAKHDRDRYKKSLDQEKENAERKREESPKPDRSRRSSPVPISSKRPQSPITEKITDRLSTSSPHRDIHSLDKSPERNTKPTSSSPMASKSSNLGSDILRSRPSSAKISNESALQTVQASLRGYLDRNEMNKPADQTTARTASARDRDSSPIARRSPSPPPTAHRRSSPPHMQDAGGGSKQKLPNERNKPGSDYRLPKQDGDSALKLRQSSPPPTDSRRASSTSTDKGGGSKQKLPNEQDKPGSDYRLPKQDGDSALKLRQSSPPPTDSRRASPTFADKGGGSRSNVRPQQTKTGSTNRSSARDLDLSSSQRPSSPSNVRDVPSRKSPISSKQSVKETPSDDDDLVVAS